MKSRRTRLGLVTATFVAVVASILAPTWAWARYNGAGAETNIIATHIMVPPGEPSCGTISLLSVHLSWAASTDPIAFTAYEVAKATVSGGPYTVVGTFPTNVFSDTVTTGGGTDTYWVVRTVYHNWRGTSPERHISSVAGLGLVALCL
jgi:hypothetical protein